MDAGARVCRAEEADRGRLLVDGHPASDRDGRRAKRPGEVMRVDGRPELALFGGRARLVDVHPAASSLGGEAAVYERRLAGADDWRGKGSPKGARGANRQRGWGEGRPTRQIEGRQTRVLEGQRAGQRRMVWSRAARRAPGAPRSRRVEDLSLTEGRTLRDGLPEPAGLDRP